jgi:hypothetical protein
MKHRTLKELALQGELKILIFATAVIGNRPKVVGDMLQSFATVQLGPVPASDSRAGHKEAATTRLLPGKNDALPSAAGAVFAEIYARIDKVIDASTIRGWPGAARPRVIKYSNDQPHRRLTTLTRA